MIFSIPIEIAFEVLNEFIKQEIPYSKKKTEEEPDELVIEIDVKEDFVDRATEIVDQIVAKFNAGGKLFGTG